LIQLIDRIAAADCVVVVGTPLYREKYENRDPGGHVVAAEFGVIGNRLLGTEHAKRTVMPILLAGDATTSFPPLLHGRVAADFRNEQGYFETCYRLVLSIHGIDAPDPAAEYLSEEMRDLRP